MRGLVVGLLVGLLAGAAGGWLARGAPAPAPPTEAPAQGAGPGSRAEVGTVPARRHVTAESQEPASNERERQPAAPREQAQILPDPDEGLESAADYAAELERIVGGESTRNAQECLTAMHRAFPEARVPFRLAQRLVAAGHAFGGDWIAAGWTDVELLEALRDAGRGTEDHRELYVFAQLAAEHAKRRGLHVPEDVVRGLLESDLAYVRRAGLMLGGTADTSDDGRLREIARSDPSSANRAGAIRSLVLRDDVRDEDLALLRNAVLTGSRKERDIVTSCLRDLGERGADIALEALSDPGTSYDGELASTLAAAALEGGRVREVLALPLARATRESIAMAVAEFLGENPDATGISDADLRRLGEDTDPQHLGEFYSWLVQAGRVSVVTDAVQSATAESARRETAFGALDWIDPDESPREARIVRDVARRLVWDTSASIALRQAAWAQLLELGFPPSTRLPEARRIVSDTDACPAALRARVVETLDDDLDADELRAALPSFRTLWNDVAASDPSAFVRTIARERAAEEWVW